MATSTRKVPHFLAVAILTLQLSACVDTGSVVRAELKVNRQTGYLLNGKVVPRAELEQQLRQLANGRQLEVAIVANPDATHEQVMGAMEATGRVAAKITFSSGGSPTK